MKSKDILMKDDITRNENLFGLNVIESITLNTRWITKKNTYTGSRLKFIPMSRQSGGKS